MDVFKGQMTNKVLGLLADNQILLKKVPPNLTNHFQPLDLTVNGAAKHFTKKKFVDWYAKQVITAIEKGVNIDDINVNLKLSTLKPLHASWIIQLYNHMTSFEGRGIIINGWRRAGILEAVAKGKEGLPPLDPFHDIDPLLDIPITLEPAEITEKSFASNYITNIDIADAEEDDEDAEWEDENGNVIENTIEDDEVDE